MAARLTAAGLPTFAAPAHTSTKTSTADGTDCPTPLDASLEWVSSGAADAAGRARLADAKASLGAQLAWDRAKAEWLASQLLEAGENGESRRDFGFKAGGSGG